MKKALATLLAVLMLLTAAAAVAEEPVEVLFWHQYTDNDVMDTIAADFNAANPDVVVKAVSVATADIRNTLKMALTSGTGPDLFYYDAGPGYLGALADAGLLYDLGPAAEQYGWKDTLAGWALTAGTYNDILYGVANEYEMLGVFYNKQIFADLGVEVPTTYDQFVEICRKAKEAGVTGLVIDDLDKWPGYHYESLFYGAFGGPEKVDGAINQTIEGGWNQPEFAEALNALASLVKEGYTSEFPNGIAHDDALRDFYTGGGAMYLTGTWAVSGMYENMGDNVGLFVFPAAKEGLENTPPVGVGSAVQVSAVTQHPEQTLRFLNYLFTADGGAKTWMEKCSCITPNDVDTTDMDLNPLFRQVLEISDTVGVYNYNIDVLVNQNINDATANFMQQILDGIITGEEAVALKQAAAEMK